MTMNNEDRLNNNPPPNDVIWKFALSLGYTTISMPVNAEILSVREQGHTVCLWAKVNANSAKEDRQFVVYGTGHVMRGDEGRFLGTCLWHDGRLVWHAFEVAKPL